MTLIEARQFIAEYRTFPTQVAAEAATGISRRTLLRRYAEAQSLVSDAELAASAKSGFESVLAATRRATTSPKAVALKVSKAAAAEAAKVAKAAKTTAAEELASALVGGDTEGLKLKLAQDENTRLRSLNKALADAALTDLKVREHIFGIAHTKPSIPSWIEGKHSASRTLPGVPILFGSDWHWGEVVNPDEIGGVNKYNLTIAQSRLNRLIETTIELLTNHMVNPQYPGIVFALGGDMVSGNIHEELSETNELPIMPVVLDLIDNLVIAIGRLKQVFGKVFLPCVSGNHGRSTKKVRAKQFNHNSYDWLIYQSLDRHFADDPDIVFFIPEGTDALVSVANHKYLFTHGNQFRGGDGMIGAIGPIIRGDHKKRSRNGQVGQEYDTMVLGHFHQLMQMKRVIVNGSLIGYNEYAYACNFGYEPPQQALWITHPVHGITMSMPVHLDVDHGKKDRITGDSPWVACFDAEKAAK